MTQSFEIHPCHAYDALIYEGRVDGLPFRIRYWKGQVLVGFGPSIAVAHLITPECPQIFYNRGIVDHELTNGSGVVVDEFTESNAMFTVLDALGQLRQQGKL